MKSYKDLLIWQRSRTLVVTVYKVVSKFPKEELFALTSQIKRCSISVPSNIAEGWGRDTNKNFINFLNIAKGSLYELETQLIIAADLKYIELSISEEISI
jgi:four helix bundle protein